MQRTAPAFASAALMACLACAGNSSDSTAMTNREQVPTAGESRAADNSSRDTDVQQQPQPISLVGCVQKGGGMLGNEYLLTTLNEPPGTVGTSGSVTRSGSSVEREQMRMAAQMYRLEPKNDLKLDDMIGKQVRVSGVITETAKLPNDAGAVGSDHDTQLPNRDRQDRESRSPRITTNELATLDVSSATVVAQSCGSRGRETSGRTDAELAGTDRNPRVVR